VPWLAIFLGLIVLASILAAILRALTPEVTQLELDAGETTLPLDFRLWLEAFEWIDWESFPPCPYDQERHG
jgi:hypothetical protein